MQDFINGFTAPWRGLRTVVRNQSLWALAAAPAAITAGMITVAVIASFAGAGPLLRWVSPGLTHPVLFLFARSAMVLLLLVMLGATSWMVAMVISIPMHDAMSERIEAMHRELPPPLTYREALPRSIRHSLAGFGLWILLQMLLLPLSLVPAIGSVIELVLGFGITAFFLAHQFMDGALSRQALSFPDKLQWLRDHLAAVLGLGTAGALMLAVPGLNLIGLPIAIAGGTLLFCELEQTL